MTGEIIWDWTNRCLKEKLLAAHRAGIKSFTPIENKKDL